MSKPEPLKMTPTCEAVIRHYAGDKNDTVKFMRLDVFQKAVTRCTRAGWLESTDVWPYTGVTELGRRAIQPEPRAGYRSAGERWVGVVHVDGRPLIECGHEHENRDMTTTGGGKAAVVCAREILDGARKPATADHVAGRMRTAWQRVNTGAGFVQPAGWLDRVKRAGADAAADYLRRVAIVREALPAEAPALVPVPAAAVETEIGDMPEWMM
jgi:hypothetical protein